MSSTILAKLLKTNENNEEDATLLINGLSIECLINSCPYAIEIGKTYPVELTLFLSDTYMISRAKKTDPPVKKSSKGYTYFLCGTLKNSVFESFTNFDDQDIHYDHPELNDQYVKLEVDRIDVNFV
jgi:hypothetical protein